jgi:hypothetical protein
VAHGSQGVALEPTLVGDGEVVQPEGEVGEVPEEAEPGVAPVDPRVDVLVGGQLGAGGDLVAEEHREDQEQEENQGEDTAEDGQDTGAACHGV